MCRCLVYAGLEGILAAVQLQDRPELEKGNELKVRVLKNISWFCRATELCDSEQSPPLSVFCSFSHP